MFGPAEDGQLLPLKLDEEKQKGSDCAHYPLRSLFLALVNQISDLSEKGKVFGLQPVSCRTCAQRCATLRWPQSLAAAVSAGRLCEHAHGIPIVLEGTLGTEPVRMDVGGSLGCFASHEVEGSAFRRDTRRGCTLVQTGRAARAHGLQPAVCNLQPATCNLQGRDCDGRRERQQPPTPTGVLQGQSALQPVQGREPRVQPAQAPWRNAHHATPSPPAAPPRPSPTPAPSHTSLRSPAVPWSSSTVPSTERSSPAPMPTISGRSWPPAAWPTSSR